MQEKCWENKYRDLLMCVDGYDGRIPTGRLVHPGLGRAVRFHGTSCGTWKRCWMSCVSRRRFPVSADSATFCLRILLRHYASWQGTVQWLEGWRSMPFRSALEGAAVPSP